MTRRDRDPFATTVPRFRTVVLSPSARVVGESLSVWHRRISEAQTLLRLVFSLLKSPSAIPADRCERLGRLLRVDARGMATLPPLDLPSLRGTTHARESGIEFRGPDAALAEAYLCQSRDNIVQGIETLAGDIQHIPTGRGESVSGLVCRLQDVQQRLDALARMVELLGVLLHPRVHDPVLAIRTVIERAAAARGQNVVLTGDGDTMVWQVRGVLRLLSELIDAMGGSVHVHAQRSVPWLYLSITSPNTELPTMNPGHAQVLHLAAYLLRIGFERRDRECQLTFVIADGEPR